MRIDHHAYQRGTQVAAFGFLLQFVIGLTLLIFGWIGTDHAIQFAATYVLLGTIVWVSLIVIFHQHKLERLEALEEDELASARSGNSSIFDAATDESRVAARRLALMYKWLMPAVSLVLVGFLCILAWSMYYSFLRLVGDAVEDGGREFLASQHVGWSVALTLSIALISFIFSRFVAGMAKLPAWQNLRGGAAYMVGNTLVMIAVAIGTAFRMFDNDTVLFVVAHIIPVFMGLMALEITLNFILNLYRPRIPGETPRPAFDSRILSLFAAPDSLVKSLNEAVDYQFGFDITSSWGYQLLLRSFVWLIALGAGVLILLNTMVIVEPHQQAVKLSWGKLVGEPHGSGIMWKLPWPLQTAEVYDISRVREIDLTARQTARSQARAAFLWSDELQTNREFDPFIVGSTSIDELIDDYNDIDFDELPMDEHDLGLMHADDDLDIDRYVPAEDQQTPEDRAAAAVSRVYALIDAEMTLQYRIKDDDGRGLLDYLNFATDVVTRRQRMSEREEALKLIALREITQYLSGLTLEEVLAVNRPNLSRDLVDRIQNRFDELRTGVQVVALNMPTIRPSDHTASKFEDMAISNQARQQLIAIARRNVTMTLSHLAGDVPTAMALIDEIDRYNDLRDELGSQHPDVIEMGADIERSLVRTGGAVAQFITGAERDRWVQLMEARSQASRTRGQQAAYLAAPELYRQREIMRVVMNTLAPVRKYVIGIDADRLHLDVELKELSPLLDFSQSFGEGE
jgi:membrane protease subunit HflK